MITIKKVSLLKYEIISTICVMVIGTLLHFAYSWTGNNPFIGIFCSVNESTWEHLKLVFFPLLISTIIGYLFIHKEYPSYLLTKTKSILIAMLFIVIFFYTYTGIIGKNISFLNIGSFYIAILLGEYYIYKHINDSYVSDITLSIIILSLCTISFITFTFKTPHLGIFKDPENNTYGIKLKDN